MLILSAYIIIYQLIHIGSMSALLPLFWNCCIQWQSQISVDPGSNTHTQIYLFNQFYHGIFMCVEMSGFMAKIINKNVWNRFGIQTLPNIWYTHTDNPIRRRNNIHRALHRDRRKPMQWCINMWDVYVCLILSIMRLEKFMIQFGNESAYNVRIWFVGFFIIVNRKSYSPYSGNV